MDYNNKDLLYGGEPRIVLSSEKEGYKFYIGTTGINPVAYIKLPKRHKYVVSLINNEIDSDDYWDLDLANNSCTWFDHVFPDWVNDQDKDNNNTAVIGWDYGHHGDYISFSPPIEGRKYSLSDVLVDVLINIGYLMKTDNVL